VSWIAALTSTLVLTTSSARDGDRPYDGDPTHGRVLFEKFCADCHGKEAQGGSAPKLTNGGLINSVSDERFLEMLGGQETGKAAHKGLKQPVGKPLDAWDIIGFLRARVPHVGEIFPQADRYLVKSYDIDKNAKQRLEKSLGRTIAEGEIKADVFTMFNIKSKTPLELVPQDPRRIDELKRPLKVGYVIFMPFTKPNGQTVQTAVALEPQGLKIVNLVAVDGQGQEDKDLNKLLSRFKDKGDRKLSGTAKANLTVGGGGKDIKALEKNVTDIYLRSLELVTAYEIEERERSWADDDVQLSDPTPSETDSEMTVN
jgi:mono/diheme cytochrome c family protein